MDLVQAVLDFANRREDPAAPPIEKRADLVERLFAGGELTLGERQYLGALALAALRRRKGPDARAAAHRREIALCARLFRVIEGKNYLAVEAAADAFGVSKSTVRTGLRELKADPSQSLEEMFAQIAAAQCKHGV
jgi:hypothetical protein